MKNPEDARTHRRRASARFAEGPDDASPSVLETLLGHFTDHMARRTMNRVKRGTREVVRWTILRLILGWVGASILAAGILFTLGAGLKGLEALRCPTWLAYLATGVFAILVALVALRGILWPREEEEGD